MSKIKRILMAIKQFGFSDTDFDMLVEQMHKLVAVAPKMTSTARVLDPGTTVYRARIITSAFQRGLRTFGTHPQTTFETLAAPILLAFQCFTVARLQSALLQKSETVCLL
jgi:hypothetical protein